MTQIFLVTLLITTIYGETNKRTKLNSLKNDSLERYRKTIENCDVESRTLQPAENHPRKNVDKQCRKLQKLVGDVSHIYISTFIQ